MSTAFLEIPLRTPAISVSFQAPLLKYIETSYRLDPTAHKADAEQLDASRIAAVQGDHPSMEKLLTYYSNLVNITGKFPFHEKNVKIAFSWNHAFQTKKKASSHDISLERSSLLFNIAARFSQLGRAENVTKPDGVKMACKYFQNAAAVFNYLDSSSLQWFPTRPLTDASTNALKCFEQLMLAQAQECFYLKCIQDNKGDALIARLAASTADFYDVAYDFMAQDKKDMPVDSEFVVHIQAKALYFHSVKEFRLSAQPRANRKYGEEICRLRAAHKFLATAVTLMSPASGMQNDVRTLKAAIEAVAIPAERDNQKIYMELIPDLKTLTPASRATMVALSPLKDIFPAPKQILFKSVVPLHIQTDVARYLQAKNQVVHQELHKVSSSKAGFNKKLQDLNLPAAVDALETPMGLPQSVLRHREIVTGEGGAAALVSTYDTVQMTKQNALTQFKETIKLLDDEAKTDTEIRQQFGSRWQRVPSENLTGQFRDSIAKYSNMFSQAEASDTAIRTKLEQYRAAIECLSGSVEDLQAMIPAHATSSALQQNEHLTTLKTLLAQVAPLQAEMAKFDDELTQFANKDDITTTLLDLHDQSIAPSTCFDSELAKYDSFKEKASFLVAKTEKLTLLIEDANSRFVATTTAADLTNARQVALNNLGVAYTAYEDIIKSLRDGMRFYTDMEDFINKLHSAVSDYVFARRHQKDELLGSIQSAATGVQQSPTPRFDPQTGQPLVPRYDPQTGMPLNSNPFAADPSSFASSAGSYPQQFGGQRFY